MTHGELKVFAEKVERMCDFFIRRAYEENADVKEINILHEIKDQAADIATGKSELQHSFIGLAEAVGIH